MISIIIQAAILVSAILMVQKLFDKKLHVYVRYGLWLLVVLRLLIPVNFINSPISVDHAIDRMRTGEFNYNMAEKPETTDHVDGAKEDGQLTENSGNAWAGGTAEDNYDNIAGNKQSVNDRETMQTGQEEFPIYGSLSGIVERVLPVIWIAGSIFVGGFLGIAHFRFRRRLYKARTALWKSPLHTRGVGRIPIYQVHKLESPCLVGFFHPAIYTGTDICPSCDSFRYVVTHEQVHYLHKDHIWALVRVILVTIYWFHPFVWIAAVCSARDGEMACDYGTVRRLGERERFSYGEMLLALSGKNRGRRVYSYGTMLRPSVSEIKERIKRLAEPNSNRVWAGVLAILLMAAMAGCAFTGEAANNQGNATKISLTNPASANEENEEVTEVLPQDESKTKDSAEEIRNESVAEPELIEAQPAQISEDTPLGVDGPVLDYAGNLGTDGENIIIFHDYFGLVVYDLSNQEIMRSLDLEPIGCHMTQGDDTCQVAVAAEGETVWLHPMSKPYMYRYEVRDNLLYQVPLAETFYADLGSEELFDRYLAVEEMTQEYIGWRSNYLYEEYQDEEGVYNTYIYLYASKEFKFRNLQCVWDDMVYVLCRNDGSIRNEQAGQDAETGTDGFPYQSDGAVADVEIFYDVPCAYSRISDSFGERTNPVTQEIIRHEGIDFAGEAGTPIQAAADGVVYEQGFLAQYGNYVVLLHGNGDMTYYCQCERITVEKDEHVKRGDTIAIMGKSGMSTGTHLHFAISRDGAFVDPGLYLPSDL